MGPNTTIPFHKHPAFEVYRILAGNSLFKIKQFTTILYIVFKAQQYLNKENKIGWEKYLEIMYITIQWLFMA